MADLINEMYYILHNSLIDFLMFFMTVTQFSGELISFQVLI